MSTTRRSFFGMIAASPLAILNPAAAEEQPAEISYYPQRIPLDEDLVEELREWARKRSLLKLPIHSYLDYTLTDVFDRRLTDKEFEALYNYPRLAPK